MVQHHSRRPAFAYTFAHRLVRVEVRAYGWVRFHLRLTAFVCTALVLAFATIAYVHAHPLLHAGILGNYDQRARCEAAQAHGTASPDCSLIRFR